MFFKLKPNLSAFMSCKYHGGSVLWHRLCCGDPLFEACRCQNRLPTSQLTQFGGKFVQIGTCIPSVPVVSDVVS